eukprot:evm.model.scf_3647.1 EVM.evm.TU.scf_3647.1   scf_3647:743-3936(+)
MAKSQEGIDEVVGSLVGEGVVDEHFKQLLSLQDDANPHFVAEVVEMFLKRSTTVVQEMEQKLGNTNPDFGVVDRMVHQFKGSSATVGAHVIANICATLREGCEQQNHALCLSLLAQLKTQLHFFSNRMEPFLELNGKRSNGCRAVQID